MSDEEIQILESYLDGALPAHEAQDVCRRLADDAAYGAAFERLRGERATRQAAWRSFEPDPASAAGFARRAAGEAVRQDRLARASRFARRATAVAACLVVAFAGGWVARGRMTSADHVAGISPAGITPAGTFQVALTDEHGTIIAVQRFSDPQKAREFAEDVDRWQSRRRPAEQREFLQTSDEF